MFVYLACNAEWYGIAQREVDSTVASHRTSSTQTSAEILATLTINEWETEFPMLDLCLRECIRLQLVGVGFRKNVSGRDLLLGKTGEAIPTDAAVIYLIDDIHMDCNVYTDPHRWDPGRYLPGRAEDKKQPLSWLGWGLGRNPCLGMRFAKLEMGIIGALFVAMYSYELHDVNQNNIGTSPRTNRKNHAASKPDVPVRLRCTVRLH